MGLFDFLSNDPVKKVERLSKKILNEHHQQQVRQEALDELVSIGSTEAITALIKRLGVNFRDTIKNEQEDDGIVRRARAEGARFGRQHGPVVRAGFLPALGQHGSNVNIIRRRRLIGRWGV